MRGTRPAMAALPSCADTGLYFTASLQQLTPLRHTTSKMHAENDPKIADSLFEPPIFEQPIIRFDQFWRASTEVSLNAHAHTHTHSCSTAVTHRGAHWAWLLACPRKCPRWRAPTPSRLVSWPCLAVRARLLARPGCCRCATGSLVLTPSRLCNCAATLSVARDD